MKRVKKRISIKFVVAFHADFKRYVRGRACNAEDHISVLDLTVIKRHLTALVDFTRGHFGGTSDAATVFTTIRQINALVAQLFKQRTMPVNAEGRAVTIGDGYVIEHHNQISLVQSPPG